MVKNNTNQFKFLNAIIVTRLYATPIMYPGISHIVKYRVPNVLEDYANYISELNSTPNNLNGYKLGKKLGKKIEFMMPLELKPYINHVSGDTNIDGIFNQGLTRILLPMYPEVLFNTLLIANSINMYQNPVSLEEVCFIRTLIGEGAWSRLIKCTMPDASCDVL